MTDLAAVVGPRLKAERERQGLSRQSAADALHLDAWVVEALEVDDYPRVGPPVYIKGYLKRYAELLGLPPAEIMFGYESRMRASSSRDSQPADETLYVSGSIFHSLPWPRISSAIAVALLLASLLWWKPWHHSVAQANVPQSAGIQEKPASSVALPAVSAVAIPVPRIASAVPATPTKEISPPPKPAAGIATFAPTGSKSQVGESAGTGQARLRLSFSADSWVDVHDAMGKRAFAGNGRANSVKTIIGMAPMHVYLGFASGVQLEINNRAVAIGRQFVAGNVARFELGADGVLRHEPRSASIPSMQMRSTQPSG